jgi:hypothetical protein
MSRSAAGEREYDVEVRHWQQLGLALSEPLAGSTALALGTVPVAAGIVRDARVCAVLAARDMAAQRCCAAALDG